MAEWISRFPYGFYSYSSQQTKQLKDFLGIDPPGVTIDFYLASRSQEQLEKWRDYWLEVWTDLQRCDLYQFTINQYTKYSKKKPEEESSSVKEGYYIHKDKCEYTTKAGKIEYTSKSKCEKALEKMREKEEEKKRKEEEKKKDWWERLKNAWQAMGVVGMIYNQTQFANVYTWITGNAMTYDRAGEIISNIDSWTLNLNVLSKLIYGINLKGQREDFGEAQDWLDLSLTAIAFIPVGKVGAVTGKLAGKTLSSKAAAELTAKLGEKETIAKLVSVVKKYPETSAKLLASYPPEVRNAVINKLGKTAYGREVIYTLGETGYFKYSRPAWKRIMTNLFQVSGVVTMIVLPIFAVTEIPNALNLRVFARKQIMQEAGTWPSDIAYKLDNYSSMLKNYLYNVDEFIKNGDTEGARDALNRMKGVLDEYKEYMAEKQANMVSEDYDISKLEVEFYEKWIADRETKAPEPKIDITGISINLNKIAGRFDGYLYDYSRLIKNKDWDGAETCVNNMESTADEFEDYLSKNIVAIEKALQSGIYRNDLDYMWNKIKNAKKEIDEGRKSGEKKGDETIINASINLNNISSEFDGLEYDLSTSIKDKDWDGARAVLKSMKEVRDQFEVYFNKYKIILDESGQTEIFRLRMKLMDNKISSMEMSIPTPEKEMPEKIKGFVRDIIDGDTIDLGLEIKNAETNESVVIPAYEKTQHIRVRMLGINAPEKSPKGEIVCMGVELYKVAGKYTDMSRERLLPLNDKEVILKIDPANQMDVYGRILGVIEYNGEDINLRQVKEGLACYYSRGGNKWIDEAKYMDAMSEAQIWKRGFWAEGDISQSVYIKFTSDPSNAELWIDGVYTHHKTPSDEIELSDVKNLIGIGTHNIEMIKGTLSASAIVEIVAGDNGIVNFVLSETGAQETEPEREEEKEQRPAGAVDISRIPDPYTTEQAWALKEYFGKIWALMGGKNVMSEKERIALKNSYTLYTANQKIVLDLLMEDIAYYEWGKDQLSNDEFKALCLKYRINDEWSVK